MWRMSCRWHRRSWLLLSETAAAAVGPSPAASVLVPMAADPPHPSLRRSLSSFPVEPRSAGRGWRDWFSDKTGIGRSDRTLLMAGAGVTLQTRCSTAVDVLNFFRVLELEDSFFSWFLVTELHVWMVSARLMAEGTVEGKEVRSAMIGALWKDCQQKYCSCTTV